MATPGILRPGKRGGQSAMGYSSAGEARQARESLGKALEALQQDEDVPRRCSASSRTSRNPLARCSRRNTRRPSLTAKPASRTRLAPSARRSRCFKTSRASTRAYRRATESIADVISILFPLTNKPSVRPDAASRRPARGGTSANAPAPSAPPRSGCDPHLERTPAQRAPSSAPPAARARPSSIARASATAYPIECAASQQPAAIRRCPAFRFHGRPSSRPPSGRPLSGAPAPFPTSMLPPPAPIPTGERQPVEANLGATTQSNFYVGFSGRNRARRRVSRHLRSACERHVGAHVGYPSRWLRVRVRRLRSLRSRPDGLHVGVRAWHGHPVRRAAGRSTEPGASLHPQTPPDLLRRVARGAFSLWSAYVRVTPTRRGVCSSRLHRPA